MKSKIQFDVDYDNQPILTVSVRHTEDVRDKVAERYIRKIHGFSKPAICGVAFLELTSGGHDDSGDYTNYTVWPTIQQLMSYPVTRTRVLEDLRNALLKSLKDVENEIENQKEIKKAST